MRILRLAAFVHGARAVILHRLVNALPKHIGYFVHIIGLAYNRVSDIGVVVHKILVKGIVYLGDKFLDKINYFLSNALVLARKLLPLLFVCQRLKAVVGNDLLLDFGLKAFIGLVGVFIPTLVITENRVIFSRLLEVIGFNVPRRAL